NENGGVCLKPGRLEEIFRPTVVIAVTDDRSFQKTGLNARVGGQNTFQVSITSRLALAEVVDQPLLARRQKGAVQKWRIAIGNLWTEANQRHECERDRDSCYGPPSPKGHARAAA